MNKSKRGQKKKDSTVINDKPKMEFHITTFEDYSQETYKEGLKNSIVYSKAKLCPWVKPDRSLFLFRRHNKFRMYILVAVESRIFETIILLAILANCIVMAMGSQSTQTEAVAFQATLDQSEIYFVMFFLIECILKNIAYGFVLHKHSYLRNGWNCLDFVIVISGIITYIMSKLNTSSRVDVKALRAFRVLRALRLLTSIPSLQVVLNSIFLALKPLVNIAGLMIFLTMIYSIVGMSLFMGRLHATCYNNVTQDIYYNPRPCRNDANNGTGYFCTNLDPLPSGQQWVCMDLKANQSLRWQGPNNGATNFDNMLYAMLTVFQIITKDSWTESMFWINDGMGSEWPWIYFVSLVLIITFFVLSLILGVLSGEFSKQSSKISFQNEHRRKKRTRKEKQDYICYKDWIENGSEIVRKMYENMPRLNQEESQEDRKGNSQYYLNTVIDGFVDYPEIDTQPQNDHQVKSFREKFSNFTTSNQKSFSVFQKKLRNVLKSRYCFIVVLALVFLNAAIMATEYTNQPEWLTAFQDYANVVFVVLFAAEMVLKLIAVGPRLYFAKEFNIFDFVVVCCSIIELCLTWTKTFNNIGISVLRCARILRIFKLTKYWDDMRKLVRNMLNSLKSIISLLLLLGLFILIFALLGMQIFGGKITITSTTRSNFDGFFNAVFSCFQVITGDSWNSVMYSAINGMGGITSVGALCALYFIILYIIGNYILLNVFLAIAVENLRREEIDEDDEEVKIYQNNDEEIENDEIEEKVDENERLPVLTDRLVLINNCAVIPPEVKNDIVSLNKIKNKDKRRVNLEQRVRINIEIEETIEPDIDPNPQIGYITYKELYMEEEDESDDDVERPEPAPSLVPSSEDFRRLKDKTLAIPTGTACFIFPDTNWFRIKCHEFVNHSICKNTVLMCILMSSVMLALEDPINDNSGRNTALGTFDYLFTGVFTIELILKMIAYGVIIHKNAFLRDPLNWLDMIVVLISWVIIFVTLFSNSQGISAIKTLRVLRVLRPLRAINRIQGLKLVLQCVIVALKTIWKILLITLLLEFMFAVIGVIIMKGAFYSCNDPTQITKSTCVGLYSLSPDNLTFVPRIWANNPLNYDNVLNGIITLFTVGTFSGWSTLLYKSIDATIENQGPVMNFRPQMFIFYIVFLIIVAFFMINIFVGMVIVTFRKEGDAKFMKYKLDKNKRECINFALKARPLVRYVPDEYKRYKMWRFVTTKGFENFIIVLILLNTVSLAVQSVNQPAALTDILGYLNVVFTVLFTIECLLKVYAFNFRNYFEDGLNIFDAIVIVGSYVDLAFSRIPLPEDAIRINLFRLFRALRLVRLLLKVETMRRLLWTFVKAIKSLPYVSLLIFLAVFIYSVMGMQFFGKISLTNANSVINRNTNFQTFQHSLLVLFRCMTGDNWQLIMLSCIYDPIATCSNSTAICGTTVSYFYFISFVMLCTFLIMNLFVAVIIDNFDYLTRDNSILGAHHLENFLLLWSQYDPDGTGQIKYSDILNMLSTVDPPLGFGKMCPQIRAFRNLNRLNIPLQTNGTVLFNATLFALVRKSLKINYSDNIKANVKELNEEFRTVVKTYWRNTSPRLIEQVLPLNINEIVTIGRLYATLVIQSFFKKISRQKANSIESAESSINKSEIGSKTSIIIRKASTPNEELQPITPETPPKTDETTVKKLSMLKDSNFWGDLPDAVWSTLEDIFSIPEEKKTEKK